MSVGPADDAVDDHPPPIARDALRGLVGRLVDAAGPPLFAVLALITGSRWVDAPGPVLLPVLQALVPAATTPTWVVLVLAAVTRRWSLAAAASVLAAVHVGLLVPWVTPGRRATAHSAGDRLVVLSSNLLFGRGDPATVVDAVRDREVDLLLLVEVTWDLRDALLDAGITDELPHMAGRPRADADAAMIFSRHPLRAPEVAPLPPVTYGGELATVTSPSGDVVVAVVHVVAPVPGFGRAWHREWTMLGTWAASVRPDLPIVIAGDFNATMDHPVLRRLGDVGIVDTLREAGRGRRATWPRIPGLSRLSPRFHIDHVQTRGFDVVDADTLVMPGSDHLAVWAELAASATTSATARGSAPPRWASRRRGAGLTVAAGAGGAAERGR